METSGVLYVHSSPPAICPHVEWAVAEVLGGRRAVSWTEQAAAPGQLRARIEWRGRPGTGGRLAVALGKWQMLRFEVTEDPSAGADGERICHLPGRGFWRAPMSANGDVMVGEGQLRAMVESARGLDDLLARLREAVGASVDAELEAYRRSGEGTAVTWLHQVG